MNHEWTDQEKQAIINEVIRLRNPDKATAKPCLCNLFIKCESCPYHTVLGLKYCLHDVSVKDEKAVLTGRSKALVLACGLELPDEPEQPEKREMCVEAATEHILAHVPINGPGTRSYVKDAVNSLVGVTIVK